MNRAIWGHSGVCAPCTSAPPAAGGTLGEPTIGTLQREALKVSEWVIYLAQVYGSGWGGSTKAYRRKRKRDPAAAHGCCCGVFLHPCGIWSRGHKLEQGREDTAVRFTESELEMIYQYAASTKDETIGGMRETVPHIKHELTRAIMENAIRKLEKLPEPECSQFIKENREQFLERRDNSILRQIARAKEREPVMQGHDLEGMERFHQDTRHMVTLDVLNNDSPVGTKGERYRFFLSDEGYRNARASEGRREIRIRSHAAVSGGRLYPDKKGQER